MEPAPTDNHFLDYFEGRSWVCSTCGHTEDLWNLLLTRVLDDHPLVPGVMSLGLGALTLITAPLRQHETLLVDFAEHGIPSDATVIDVVMTPQTNTTAPGLFPAVAVQHLQIRGLPHSLALYPVAWPSADLTDPAATDVNIMIIWMPAPAEPEQEPLFSAGKAFTTGDYRGSIVPAQIAVELKLAQVLTDHYSQFAGKDVVRQFLTDGATYGHQLRFLLPSLFGSVGAPPLPEVVSNGLQGLRKKRNKVGHEHYPTERSEAALMLLAGLFGYRYLMSYGPLLAPGSA